MRRRISYIVFAALLMLSVAGCSGRLIYLKIATTVGIKTSGVLDPIISDFEKKYNVKVAVVSVGTDQSIEMSKNGDVDLMIVRNSPELKKFNLDGYAHEIKTLMANNYIIVGPENDPLNLAGMDAVSAIEKLSAQTGHKYLTRGWGSGVYAKDLILLEKSEVEGGPWYKKTGQTVEGILVSASQLGAYAMADRATFVRLRSKLKLKLIVDNDPLLENTYSIVVTSPEKIKDVKVKLADMFFKYICSKDGQFILKNFGKDRYSEPLFTNICEQEDI